MTYYVYILRILMPHGMTLNEADAFLDVFYTSTDEYNDSNNHYVPIFRETSTTKMDDRFEKLPVYAHEDNLMGNSGTMNYILK
jgi:hypothetical protein